MKIIPCEVCGSPVCWVVDRTGLGDLLYLEVVKN